MMAEPLQPDEVSVLTTQADWAWPMAVRDIFQPRGVNLLVADGIDEFVNVLRHRRIAATIIDTDSPEPGQTRLAGEARRGGLWGLRIIRVEYPLTPCILLTSNPTEAMLEEALQLDAFSVIDKPVDMRILIDQLNRLFIRKYSSHIFSI
jgi:DNA-binding NarL/FixJ family response regulator